MREHLSARRREALRLDLEDRRKGLRAQWLELIRQPCKTPQPGVPEEFRSRLERCRRSLDLVCLALERVELATFGTCDRCGETMPFDDLAADATRSRCAGSCVNLSGTDTRREVQ